MTLVCPLASSARTENRRPVSGTTVLDNAKMPSLPTEKLPSLDANFNASVSHLSPLTEGGTKNKTRTTSVVPSSRTGAGGLISTGVEVRDSSHTLMEHITGRDRLWHEYSEGDGEKACVPNGQHLYNTQHIIIQCIGSYTYRFIFRVRLVRFFRLCITNSLHLSHTK